MRVRCMRDLQTQVREIIHIFWRDVGEGKGIFVDIMGRYWKNQKVIKKYPEIFREIVNVELVRQNRDHRRGGKATLCCEEEWRENTDISASEGCVPKCLWNGGMSVWSEDVWEKFWYYFVTYFVLCRTMFVRRREMWKRMIEIKDWVRKKRKRSVRNHIFPFLSALFPHNFQWFLCARVCVYVGCVRTHNTFVLSL